MRKLFVLIAIFISTTTLSQSCLPEGITFTTQEQIDNFQTDFPGCIEIEGSVVIEENSSNITNLSGLNVLTSIGGSLWIRNNASLLNMTGLNNLISVGEFVSIQLNDALLNLAGLENL
ncbi:MAG: hypothetical protein DRI54_06290, partial [Bacteroidetes bacterium]